MARADSILGLRRNREVFAVRLHHNNKLTRMAWSFTVSAYRREMADDRAAWLPPRYCFVGPVRYAEASDGGPYGRKSSVGYRIRVTPKRTR